MKCAKCGAEIRPGCIYCANCGQEAQVVSEISVLEEDLLRTMMDDEKKQKETQARQEEPRANRGQEGRREPALEKQRVRKRKKTVLAVVLLLAILGAAAGCAYGYFRYREANSFEHLMGEAREAYGRRNYQSAISSVDRALEQEPENRDAIFLKGQICALQKEYGEAEKLFRQVLTLEPSDAQAYAELLKIFDRSGDYQKITGLYAQAQESGAGDQVLDLFASFLVFPPSFSLEGGTYDYFPRVTVTAGKNGKDIYYTLDGTAPTRSSSRYKSAIEISEPGETVLTAVCADRDGNLSESVSAVYLIDPPAPDLPEVMPDGGQFTEPGTVTVEVPAGVTVYYTWDGTAPTERSRKYSGPLDIPEGNNILSLIAVDRYGKSSGVLKCNYIYYPE